MFSYSCIKYVHRFYDTGVVIVTFCIEDTMNMIVLKFEVMLINHFVYDDLKHNGWLKKCASWPFHIWISVADMFGKRTDSNDGHMWFYGNCKE